MLFNPRVMNDYKFSSNESFLAICVNFKTNSRHRRLNRHNHCPKGRLSTQVRAYIHIARAYDRRHIRPENHIPPFRTKATLFSRERQMRKHVHIILENAVKRGKI